MDKIIPRTKRLYEIQAHANAILCNPHSERAFGQLDNQATTQPLNIQGFINNTFCSPPEGYYFGVGIGKYDTYPIGDDKTLPYAKSRLATALSGHSNVDIYICTSYLNGEWYQQNDGSPSIRRKESNCGAWFLFVCDDVGTKVSADQIQLKPTYKIETSWRNFQWGFALSEPVDDPRLVKAILKAAAKKGLTDAGGLLRAKLVRLPTGYNNKDSWKLIWEHGYQIRLIEYSGQKYTADKLIDGLRIRAVVDKIYGIHPDQPTNWADSIIQRLEREIANHWSSGVLKHLLREGYIQKTDNELEAIKMSSYGFIPMICPWESEHSTHSGGTGFSPAGFGRDKGQTYELTAQFKCHHDHCKNRGTDTFREWCVDQGYIDEAYSLKKLEALVAGLSENDVDSATKLAEQVGRAVIPSTQKDHLLRKIKKVSGVGIMALRDVANTPAKAKVTHKKLARSTVQTIGAANIFYTVNGFYWWSRVKRGVWQYTDDHEIRKEIQAACEHHSKHDFTKGTIDSVLQIVKTDLFKQDQLFNIETNRINCPNGELGYQDREWTLFDHERSHYFVTQIPVIYNPKATAPRFEQFLAEVFEGDSDSEGKTRVVLEMMGYSLLSTTRYEKFMILVGSGANGKSVLLTVVEALLGRMNVSAVQPSQFDNKFQRAHLHGKLANLITEIAEGTVIADAQLKAIVSGELTTAEHKMKQPFDFRPFATCWFGTNHMPHTRDFSDALFRRATVLEFPNVFKGDNCDPHLKDKLLDELPGILNLALKAIGSVIQRGTFMTCESNEQAKAAWRMEADQVAQFIEDECKIDVDASTNVSILYNRYKKWVMDSGIKHKVTKRTFSDRLDTLGFPSSRGSKGVRVKKGIRLKSYMHEEKAIIRQAIDEHSGTE